ncbi:MAG TPA: hypothetical protein VFV19_05890 [Candidatus Polarisedimenticolaceae bacterium]|nr:hypothetical protein [Candidatus Polarisedimenticolaceae bacterium]
MASSRGNRGTAKFFFIGGGVVAAIALVVFFQNYPPKPADATGTIQGASRYHETQITPSDVKVAPDALSTWIQSDTFDKIVKDPDARKLFASGAVSQLFTNDAVRLIALDATKVSAGDAQKLQKDGTNLMVAGDSTGAAIKGFSSRNIDNGAQHVMSVGDARKLIESGDAQSQRMVIGDARSQRLVAGDAQKMVVGDAQKMVVGDAQKMVVGDAANKFITVGDAHKLFQSDAVRQALENPAIQQALKDSAFCQALQNAATMNALQNEAQKVSPLRDDATKQNGN